MIGLGLAHSMLALKGIDDEVAGFVLAHPKASSADVYNFLKLYSAGDARNSAAHALLAKGIDPGAVSSALSMLEAESRWKPSTVYGVLTITSSMASAFHGYRRNNGSILWAVIWGGLGLIFPIFTPVIALAQGYGKRKAA